MRVERKTFLGEALDFLPEDYKLTEAVEFMRFTLYYDGPLASAANNARLKNKHGIREQLHWQLLQLFRDHPALPKPIGRQDWANWSEWKWPQLVYGIVDIGRPAAIGQVAPLQWQERYAVVEIGALHFVPLVRATLDLICELDVLFLRPGQPGLMGRLDERYDIDNRLLTLFDALTLPKGSTAAEYALQHNTLSPTSPIFCLLGDDDRITVVNVRTDSLLAKAEGAKEDHVRLIIGVTLRATNATWVNRGLAE